MAVGISSRGPWDVPVVLTLSELSNTSVLTLTQALPSENLAHSLLQPADLDEASSAFSS